MSLYEYPRLHRVLCLLRSVPTYSGYKVVADGVGQGYKEVQEISPNLRYIIDELDQICQRDRSEVDLKRKILDDLRHLESVVTNKISEIEADLEKLTRK